MLKVLLFLPLFFYNTTFKKKLLKYQLSAIYYLFNSIIRMFKSIFNEIYRHTCAMCSLKHYLEIECFPGLCKEQLKHQQRIVYFCSSIR